MKKAHQYLHLLLKTYSLFFKSAPDVAIPLLFLIPMQTLVPLAAIAAGQGVIDNVSSNENFTVNLIIWITATLLSQFFPSLATSLQGVLTDKLTGFVNTSLMKKSQSLQSLEVFDDSTYFDDLQMLRDDASWRPVNLIVFGISVIQSSLTLVFMLGYLAKYNWILALLILAVMIPQSITYYRIQQESFETMVERSKNARYLHYYSGLLLDRKDAKEVRLFNMFPEIIEKYVNMFNETKKDVNRIRRKQLLASSSFLILVIAVFGYGFYWFANETVSGMLKVGVLLMYISVISYVSSSMARLVEDSSLLYDSLLWIKKYFNFLDYKDRFTAGSSNFPADYTELKVEHVSFTYPFSDAEVLHDVSFAVKKGEKIAVVGENGCGKSTLVKLLMRYYDPSAGQIKLDQTNIKDLAITDYHKHLSATFQDFSKFKLSLGENVSAAKAYDETDVKAALTKAGVDNLLTDKGLALNRPLAKDFAGGTDLSGGQWQKVALARDLYANGEIEFLDEPTAALDARSEAEIYQRFLQTNQGKTIFFVTHRLSAVKFADRVLFLAQGKVAGFDTHEQLMQQNSAYREMYNLQKDAYL